MDVLVLALKTCFTLFRKGVGTLTHVSCRTFLEILLIRFLSVVQTLFFC